MNRVQPEKQACCGCTACANICPKNAIVMVADSEGFVYPQIDDAACVDCGLCQKACPIDAEKVVEDFPQRYAAVQHREAEVVETSSSGGMFSALAMCVLAKSGVVYGAAFEEGFVVRHGRASDEQTVVRFRGSKYVQSDVGSMMAAVAEDLKKGTMVLFTGTPCQVHGLNCYLAAKRVATDTLLTCDFVCHGVSSPKVWADYIRFLQAKHGELTRYNFRGKENGWHKYYPDIRVGEVSLSKQYKEKESYFRMYSSSVITRPSCYACRYTSYERPSDLTLADFWNIDKAAPDMNDDKGTSQVLVNTARGNEWFEACADRVRVRECKKEDVWQPHLEYPIKSPKSRAAFWQAYANQPFEQTIRRYGQYPFLTKCRHAIMPLINKLGLYTLAGKLYKLVFVHGKKQG